MPRPHLASSWPSCPFLGDCVLVTDRIRQEGNLRPPSVEISNRGGSQCLLAISEALRANPSSLEIALKELLGSGSYFRSHLIECCLSLRLPFDLSHDQAFANQAVIEEIYRFLTGWRPNPSKKESFFDSSSVENPLPFLRKAICRRYRHLLKAKKDRNTVSTRHQDRDKVPPYEIASPQLAPESNHDDDVINRYVRKLTPLILEALRMKPKQLTAIRIVLKYNAFHPPCEAITNAGFRNLQQFRYNRDAAIDAIQAITLANVPSELHLPHAILLGRLMDHLQNQQ